ncbi:unnamed protein product [Arabidopsis thaliana]|uniref:Uncharacterized protein n=2 Tax=Arabidopsis thaliana TaxID=3702 RepID=A0A654FVT1_ARATH|nr:uncharacterized protein AT4G35485 [Arabidopsis thaliana]ANM67007.1 hypothetical protein AT4G35485 [Arabidopsis thaliana]CAA0397584.1 unnamed protein product [Arabidopsis thaliana]VYS64980.1 unnamed protein product [Arabidopsis thaliana]|eukprot:NP_001328865.1 hypothetical protein AT4G35485 [Arabidopsis thaliana]
MHIAHSVDESPSPTEEHGRSSAAAAVEAEAVGRGNVKDRRKRDFVVV